MTLLSGLLAIGLGVAMLGFGLFLFYALLPFFYGLFGAGVGFGIARVFTGNTPEARSWVDWVWAIGFAVLFAALAYYLEPFRRLLLGSLLGANLGFALAGALNLWTWVGFIVALVGALIFSVIVTLAFDPLIILASTISGAALIMDGVNLILPGDWFNRGAIAGGAFMPLLVWIILAVVGLAWQYSNITNWVRQQVRDTVLAKA